MNIYHISRKDSDQKLMEEFLKQGGDFRQSIPRPQDYANVIVKKPWGYEYLVFENEFTAIWMLHIVRKRQTSFHAHRSKKTALILLSGNAHCRHLEGEINLESPDGIVIEGGAFHSTEAVSPLSIEPHSENGIWVMEIESPPLKEDLVRAKDEYGRKDTSYEGPNQMVFEPKQCLKLSAEENRATAKEFFNYLFEIMPAANLKRGSFGAAGAMVSVIGRKNSQPARNPCLEIGGLLNARDFCENTQGEDLSGYTVLTVQESRQKSKVSDYIFSFIAGLGVKEVFAVCGGGAMHLVDSLGRAAGLSYIAVHHEQAAAMAAEAYARVSGKPGVTLVTSGPGGTNTITGVCGAWIDSIPVIFISGQVTSDTLLGTTGLRQFGIQEADIVRLVAPVTKYAVTVTDACSVKYHLQKALYLATTGRPGPVWLDLPLDVQSKIINPDELASFSPNESESPGQNAAALKSAVERTLQALKEAKRPVLISGYGIRLSGAITEYRQLVEKLGIPVVSSWTTSDLIATDSALYTGRSGIMGDRAGNFAVANADLLLVIGSRMSIPQVGYNYKTFAREAKKIVVDIDEAELNKPSLKPDIPICADAKAFIAEMLAQLNQKQMTLDVSMWTAKCLGWKGQYPVALAEYQAKKDAVNSFYFIDLLSQKLDSRAIVVTDMGTSFTCTMQAFATKLGQRLFTSSGHASMGFGLPGAIGACLGSGRKKTVCISGDGGLQMNIQELQTLVSYRLPVILFVLNNDGYLTIKLMQQNHFGKYVGSDAASGLSCPDIVSVARAYGLSAQRISNHDELRRDLDTVLAQPGPAVCEIVMPGDQPLIPRVASLKTPDGTIISKPLEDMYPFLERQEFLANMIIKPVEILKE